MGLHKREDGLRNAYLLAGMRFGVLVRLVLRYGVSFRLRYLLRLLFLLQAGLWASVLAWVERKKARKRPSRTTAPEDPIFIVGHWRTGTTYLHQLFGLDPALTTPTLFQCCFPDSFQSSRRFVEPFMRRYVTGRRPMDEVQVHMDAPHEEEFALFRLTGRSPLERLVFPADSRYFLVDDETFLTPGLDPETWRTALSSFLEGLHVHTGKRPVLKNPFNGLRIPELARLFPKSLFVHIRRNPLAVIPSTVHMWSIVGAQNSLRSAFAPPPVDQVTAVYARFLTRIRHDLVALPETRRVEIGFEELEAAPVDTMRAVYGRLGLPFSKDLEKRIDEFLIQNAAYRKNIHHVSPMERAQIETRLGLHMAEYREEAS